MTYYIKEKDIPEEFLVEASNDADLIIKIINKYKSDKEFITQLFSCLEDYLDFGIVNISKLEYYNG